MLSKMRCAQRGITLTETLLAVMVSILMLVWMGEMQAQSMEDLRAKNTAEYYQAVNTLAQQYFKTNRAALIAAMDTGASASTWCTENNTVKKLCAANIARLKSNSGAPTWFNDFNPYNQTTIIAYRLVNASSGSTEILIYGAANGTNHKIIQNTSSSLASQLMGGNGGMIPAQATGACATTEACGVFGGWKATLNNFSHGTATPLVGSVASYAYML